MLLSTPGNPSVFSTKEAAIWLQLQNPNRHFRTPVKVDPKHYKVEIEHDRVRVLRINYGPRKKSPMHGHPSGVVVFLTDQRSKFTHPDGKTEEVVGKAGETRFLDAFQHLPETATNHLN